MHPYNGLCTAESAPRRGCNGNLQHQTLDTIGPIDHGRSESSYGPLYLTDLQGEDASTVCNSAALPPPRHGYRTKHDRLADDGPTGLYMDWRDGFGSNREDNSIFQKSARLIVASIVAGVMAADGPTLM